MLCCVRVKVAAAANKPGIFVVAAQSNSFLFIFGWFLFLDLFFASVVITVVEEESELEENVDSCSS